MPAPDPACAAAGEWLSARHDAHEGHGHPTGDAPPAPRGRRAAADGDSRVDAMQSTDDDGRVDALEDHVASCARCQAFAAGLARVDAALPAVAAAPAPDVVGPALAAWRARERTARAGEGRLGRVVLGLAGVGGVLQAVVGLVVLQPGPGVVHFGRDLLGFTLAFSIAFLLAARRPRRYGVPLLPITGAAALVVLLLSAADVTTGGADLLVEAGHLTVLAGLAGLLLLPGASGGRRRDAVRPVPTMAE